VTEKDQTVIPPLNGGGGNGLSGRLEAFDGFTGAEDRPAEFAPGLVSFGFIKAAIRRGAWFWRVTAIIGFLAGFGMYVATPHAYQASTSLLLTTGPYEEIYTAAADDQAIAQSHAVATLAMHKLGMAQSVDSFLGAYKVTILTNRVLLITASAPSSTQAEHRASAVAAAYLQFRANELETEQELMLGSINQQINQVTQNVKSITTQISQLSAQPSSPAQQSQLSNLRAERSQATTTLTNLESTLNGDRTTTTPATTAAAKGSVVLDAAAPLPHSRLKPLLLYAVIGLIVGLALGMSILVFRALVSDRLRWRGDVAQALGAPVKLSVGTMRVNRGLPVRRGLAAARDADVRRVAAHLGRAVQGTPRDFGTLAVVPVDDPQPAAQSLVSLAVSCAQQGMKVVLADLASGAPTARLLGATNPGVSVVSGHDARLVIAVPEPDDVVPAGPLGRATAEAERSPFTEAVAAACASADVLLTLAALDPSLGGDHLSTWATDAVAVVTAGRSSWEKIEAVGEMIRLSGTRLVSAVLVGADNTDESLGLTPTPQAGRDAQVMEHGSAVNGFIVAFGEGQGSHRPATGDPRIG
jgi:capsular polysaccharide biosynthesis protein